MSTDAAPDDRPMMAVVNESIDRLHASLELPDSEFFCECGHPGCKERITLTRAEYARFSEDSRPVLAAAHASRGDAAATELHELRGRVHQLEGTLASRANIEQAKGILSERGTMTPDEAFESLRQRARDRGQSLEEVCAGLVAEVAEGSSGEPNRAALPETARRRAEERRGR